MKINGSKQEETSKEDLPPNFKQIVKHSLRPFIPASTLCQIGINQFENLDAELTVMVLLKQLMDEFKLELCKDTGNLCFVSSSVFNFIYY